MTLEASIPAGPVTEVVARWHAGDRFGVLCTGDAAMAEAVYRSLAPTADHAFGNAESVGAEVMSSLRGERIVALAWDLSGVDPALLRRCTAILNCGDRSGFPRKVLRSPADVVAATVRVLAEAGVSDHEIDLAACRLASGLHNGGCGDPLWVLRTVVAEPRRQGLPGNRADDDPSSADEEPHAVVESAVDGTEESTQSDGAEYAAGDPAEDAGTSGESDQEDIHGEPDPQSEPSSHQTCGPEDDDTNGGVANKVPQGGPDPDSHDTASGVLVAEAGGLEQGLGVAADVADARVERALAARPSRRVPDPRTHIRGSRGPRQRSPECGPIVRVVPPERAGGRVAVIPTLYQAALRAALSADSDVESLRVRRADLRGAIRRRRGGHHTVFIVDGSSSLGRSGLLVAGAAVDQAVAAIAARRGVVSAIVAAGQRARVVVNRSTSLARTRHALAQAPTGGGTPLAHAIRLSLDLLTEDELPRRRVLLLTDGRPTVGLGGTHLPAAAAAEELGEILAELTESVPEVSLVLVGAGSAATIAPFVTAGVRIAGS